MSLKKIVSILFFIASTVPFHLSALAQPVITGVSGSLSHGTAVTISGLGFGSKTAGPPIIWDDFEKGIQGGAIKGNLPVIGPAWDDYFNGTIGPKYSNVGVRPNSTVSSFHDFLNGGSNISLEYSGQHSSVYFTFWWKMQKQSTSWSRNIKPWLEYGSDGLLPMTYAGLGMGGTADSKLRSSVQDNPTINIPTLWGSTRIEDIENEWVRFEVYLVQSTPNVPDGKYKMWVHRPSSPVPSILLDLNGDAYITRTTTKTWRQWHFGSYFAKDNPTDARALVYIDDLYFDTTQARVEIGNAPNWTAVTHREIQVPTSWADTSVQVTLNKGSFGSLNDTYLYIVNADGTANPVGFPLCQDCPQPPKNLQVQ